MWWGDIEAGSLVAGGRVVWWEDIEVVWLLVEEWCGGGI